MVDRTWQRSRRGQPPDFPDPESQGARERVPAPRPAEVVDDGDVAELLEREGELARVGDALGRAKAGRGGAVLIWGLAGIGKSSLLAAARVSAGAAGARVLRARGAELEREFAFGVVRQLFDPVLAAASAAERAEWLDGAAGDAARLVGLPGAMPAAAARLPDPSFTMLPDPSFAILHGLYWLCAQLAAAGPL